MRSLTLFERIPGPNGRLRRRSFLTAGALGAAGIALADLLRAESTAERSSPRKAIINVHLDGGPSQLESIDPKPSAPVEIRGELSAISTTIPGVQLSEVMPRTAALLDRFALIRSLVGSAGAHNGFQCQSGFAERDMQAIGGRPAVGAVVSRLLGKPSDVAPPFIDLMQGRPLVRNSARSGYLGPAFQPFRPDISQLFERQLEAGMVSELARRGASHQTSLALNPALDADRLRSRDLLRASLDTLRRDVDGSGMMEALDQFSQQAASILLSGTLQHALEIDREDPAVLRRYLPEGTANVEDKFYTSEGPRAALKFLLARRLVEAGARCVSISISDFDTHSQNFPRMRQLMPIVDHGLCALVEDLASRGTLDEVTIVAWGEFGRTPRIDGKTGGRHHWPQVSPVILAGGGLRTGQVIGATDRDAGAAKSRPVTYKDIIATLYHTLGIDPRRTTLPDPQGRPLYLLDDGQPVAELV